MLIISMVRFLKYKNDGHNENKYQFKFMGGVIWALIYKLAKP